jgi:probable HAF family extracellular repeat protein
MRDLGAPGSTQCTEGPGICNGSQAADINDSGEIVGTTSQQAAPGLFRPFVWSNGVMQDPGFLPGQNVWALFNNNAGQIAGITTSASGTNQRGWRFDHGTITTFSFPGGETTVTGMNERGDVMGQSRSGGGQLHAFVWRDGQMTDLGAFLAGASAATAINDHGDVVGWHGSDDEHGERQALLWRLR